MHFVGLYMFFFRFVGSVYAFCICFFDLCLYHIGLKMKFGMKLKLDVYIHLFDFVFRCIDLYEIKIGCMHLFESRCIRSFGIVYLTV